MNFSFSLILVSLSLSFASCEECSDALHETFKRNFDLDEKCDDCVIIRPGLYSREEHWTGFCAENQLYLFQDWKCKDENNLFNIVKPFAVVTSESCELIDSSSALNEKCFRMFNFQSCSRRRSENGIKNKRDEDEFININKGLMRVEFGDTPYQRRSSTRPPTSTQMTETSTEAITNLPTKEEVTSTDVKTAETTYTGTTTQSSEMPNTIRRGKCETNEFYFDEHCYFIKSFYLDDPRTLNVNTTVLCREQHPNALGLAVETTEENAYIMNLLCELSLCNSIVFSSGVTRVGFPHQWSGWNTSIDRNILHFKPSNEQIQENMYYCINAGESFWYLLGHSESKLGKLMSYVICERLYNPKNVQLDLYERCLQKYRASVCYNAKKHSNYCCENDDTGELWFGCPLEKLVKQYNSGFSCEWICEKEGFFRHSRPTCSGMYKCDAVFKGIRYTAPATRYAVASCPAGYFGNSFWYCSWNRTFSGIPDFSCCCEGTATSGKQCRDTDTFLNVWTGCPSKKVTKKTTCPPDFILDEALVEWYCQHDGNFYGIAPNYSNCKISNGTQCTKTDRFGTKWTAAAGIIAKKNCPRGYKGLCFWYCKISGIFDGPQPDCSRCKADWMNEVTDKIKNQTNHQEVMEIMERFTEKEDLTIGYVHILNLTAECVTLYKRQASELSVFKKFLKSYSNILKNVAGNPNTWSKFSVDNRRNYSARILQTTQNAAFANLEMDNGSSEKYNETFAKSQNDGFDFFVAYNPSVGSGFPLENISESDWYLDIKEIDDSNPKLAAMGLVMSYSLSSLMFPPGNQTEDLEINAPAITFTVAASKNGKIIPDPNVIVSISFKHRNKTRMPESIVIRRRLHIGEQPSGVFKSTLCYYYRDSDWTTKGCTVTFTSKDRTNCTCNHLSTIGLLMSMHKYEPNAVLEIVSTVSSGITIISLILALLVFFFCDKVGNDRLLIGKNLCFCLLVGHIMLITVVDKKFFNIPDNVCVIFAVLLHYVFMAAFAWMFVEGYHLYRLLILVFDSGVEYRLIYMLIGYGMPFLVVLATHIVGFFLHEQPYGQDEMCWLKPPIYVWAFVGPVIILTSINFCILVIAMKLAIASKRKTEKSNIATLMLWMKRWVSLSALLGITWLFGLAYFNYNEPLVYTFVFFNGLQGFFIFLFRCVLCEQYKTVFLKKIKNWYSKSTLNNHKKVETVKSETKLFAISGTKSLTESRDSGYDPGVEEGQKCSNFRFSKSGTNTKNSPKKNFSGIDVTLTPAISEAYLRNKMIEKNFSVRKSKADLLAASDNFPELSYHNICHPN